MKGRVRVEPPYSGPDRKQHEAEIATLEHELAGLERRELLRLATGIAALAFTLGTIAIVLNSVDGDGPSLLTPAIAVTGCLALICALVVASEAVGGIASRWRR